MDRDDRDDVRGADPRVRADVQAQVDPVPRAHDSGEQRVDELLVAADEREDRAVVVLVDVHVEQVGVRGQRGADRSERRAVAPLREVRDGFERKRRTDAHRTALLRPP